MKKNNAIVYAEESGKYTNLYVTFLDKNGSEIKLLVRPVTKDKKSLAKLMYKIRIALGE